MDTFSDVNGDDALRVVADVVNGVPVEKSRLHYNAATLRLRKAIEADVANMPPNMIVDLPNELPPAEMVVPD